jgi:hypothetical protein
MIHSNLATRSAVIGLATTNTVMPRMWTGSRKTVRTLSRSTPSKSDLLPEGCADGHKGLKASHESQFSLRTAQGDQRTEALQCPCGQISSDWIGRGRSWVFIRWWIEEGPCNWGWLRRSLHSRGGLIHWRLSPIPIGNHLYPTLQELEDFSKSVLCFSLSLASYIQLILLDSYFSVVFFVA